MDMLLDTLHGDMVTEEEVVCKMNMAFHWGTCEFILWRSWQANTPAKFAAACVGFFLMAMMYEALKFYREELLVRDQKARRTLTKSSNGTTEKIKVKERMFTSTHFVQTALHVLQVFTSYILMLIVMLCNLYLIIAICLGAATGYFLFGWMRKISCSDVGECCY